MHQRLPLFLGFCVMGGAVEQRDQVGIMFDATAIAEIRNVGDVATVASGCRAVVELREDKDGNGEFLGQTLQAGGDLGDFTLAGFQGMRQVGFQDVEVVEGDESDVIIILAAPGLGTQGVNSEAGSIVNE